MKKYLFFFLFSLCFLNTGSALEANIKKVSQEKKMIIIDKGSEDGIKIGDYLYIIQESKKGPKKIARVEVTKRKKDSAICKITKFFIQTKISEEFKVIDEKTLEEVMFESESSDFDETPKKKKKKDDFDEFDNEEEEERKPSRNDYEEDEPPKDRSEDDSYSSDSGGKMDGSFLGYTNFGFDIFGGSGLVAFKIHDGFIKEFPSPLYLETGAYAYYAGKSIDLGTGKIEVSVYHLGVPGNIRWDFRINRSMTLYVLSGPYLSLITLAKSGGSTGPSQTDKQYVKLDFFFGGGIMLPLNEKMSFRGQLLFSTKGDDEGFIQAGICSKF